MVVNAIPLTPNTFCDVTGPFAVCFLRQLARGLSLSCLDKCARTRPDLGLESYKQKTIRFPPRFGGWLEQWKRRSDSRFSAQSRYRHPL